MLFWGLCLQWVGITRGRDPTTTTTTTTAAYYRFVLYTQIIHFRPPPPPRFLTPLFLCGKPLKVFELFYSRYATCIRNTTVNKLRCAKKYRIHLFVSVRYVLRVSRTSGEHPVMEVEVPPSLRWPWSLNIQPIFGRVDERDVIHMGSAVWKYSSCTFRVLPEKSTS